MEVISRSRHPKRVDTSIVSTLDIGKVCLCPTNSVFADKDPCPKGEKITPKSYLDKDKNNERKDRTMGQMGYPSS